jgi:hypothetical protein
LHEVFIKSGDRVPRPSLVRNLNNVQLSRAGLRVEWFRISPVRRFWMSYPLSMSIESILAEIDAEIARLTQVRSLLAGSRSISSSAAVSKAKGPARRRKKRVLSAEARKRIADAQRKRWAAQKAKSKKD